MMLFALPSAFLFSVLSAAPERPVPAIGELVVPTQAEVGQFALSGGGEVWIMERREFPLVGMAVSLSWDGAIAEPKERLAARLSSMLMDSGATLTRPESIELSDMGIRWAAGVNDHHLWGSLVAPSGREEQAIHAFTALFLEPELKRKALKARRAWWAGWRSDLGHDLDRTHERAINHAVFTGGHPWRNRVQANTLAKVSWRTARKMPEQIAQNGALNIAVVGDVDSAALLPVLEAYFGENKGTAQAHPSAPPEMEKGLHLVDQQGFGIARVSLVLPIPGRADPKHFVAAALSRVLAGRETSRLDVELREEQGLAYSFDALITQELNWGLLRLDTEVLPEKVGALLDAMNALVDEVRDEGVLDTEFESIRRGLVLEKAQQLTLTAPASAALLGLMQANQAPDAFLAEATIFSLLQPEELNAFSQEVLVDGGRTWVVSGDAEVIRPQLAERGWEFATDTDAKTLSEVP
jgi:predicted Zn-dependent peptidase